MEILGRRRAPDGRPARRPYLRPLRLIVMPGTRLEIAELLVEHLIHFAEELDDLIVVVAVVGGDVVTRAVEQGSNDDGNLIVGENIGGVVEVGKMLEITYEVMYYG